ncbi:50S ribosomal protein L4 [Candidatus Woesebacteria bacterium GWB1_43_5]|uniref:Large ribosomal subunit protein uL4 n=1 Tax=Candidatus Woesebacteria bacterium GWB1_43_5 TaxID=1802474 RepID=A0A1F7WT90_9BACT|nr:MAG: 50S ribosomal protein L4 [Candidatus Woesebacteria bacterium GWB1_43_5]
MKAKVYSKNAKSTSTLKLPREFSEEENLPLLAQAIRVYEAASHPGLARVKTRAEVAISKRKIYKQKHTGRARHGAKSAPIFVGGGIAHGPKGIKRELTMPIKMKRKALSVAMSLKAKKGQVVAVGIDKIQNTKEAGSLLDKIFLKEELKKGSNATLALSSKNWGVVRTKFRNIKNINIVLYKDLNAYNVFFGGLLIVDKEIFDKRVKDKK